MVYEDPSSEDTECRGPSASTRQPYDYANETLVMSASPTARPPPEPPPQLGRDSISSNEEEITSTIQTTSDEDSRTTSVRVDRDGEKTTRTPDGVVISNHPDGSLHQRFPDGTVIYVDANGVMTAKTPT